MLRTFYHLKWLKQKYLLMFNFVELPLKCFNLRREKLIFFFFFFFFFYSPGNVCLSSTKKENSSKRKDSNWSIFFYLFIFFFLYQIGNYRSGHFTPFSFVSRMSHHVVDFLSNMLSKKGGSCDIIVSSSSIVWNLNSNWGYLYSLHTNVLLRKAWIHFFLPLPSYE